MNTSPRPPRQHVAYFLATLAWAGCTLTDDGARITAHGDAAGLLQREVDARAGAIRAWWRECEREQAQQEAA